MQLRALEEKRDRKQECQKASNDSARAAVGGNTHAVSPPDETLSHTSRLSSQFSAVSSSEVAFATMSSKGFLAANILQVCGGGGYDGMAGGEREGRAEFRMSVNCGKVWVCALPSDATAPLLKMISLLCRGSPDDTATRPPCEIQRLELA